MSEDTAPYYRDRPLQVESLREEVLVEDPGSVPSVVVLAHPQGTYSVRIEKGFLVNLLRYYADPAHRRAHGLRLREAP